MTSIDRTELLRLYRLRGPTLVLYARTWTDAEGAQDAVQEAFVALFLQHGAVENARAWLFVAVRRRALDAARSRRRRERREAVVPVPPVLSAGPGAAADRE